MTGGPDPITGRVWIESDLSANAWDESPIDQPVALQQSYAYGEAVARQGATAIRLEYREGGRTLARAQIIQRQMFGPLKALALFRGPVWLEELDAHAASAAILSLKAQFKKRAGRFLFVMPEAEGGFDASMVMRGAGMRRVMTGYSTVWLDLLGEEDALRESLAQKWRASLNAAERAGLDVSVSGKKAHQYRWLLDREEEQRVAVKYVGLPTGIVEDFAEASNQQGVVAFTAIHEREKVAGMLFLLHGTSATYFAGWSGDVGRKVSAHNLLLWRAMLELKVRGVRWLDLGGLNTEDGAGIARFKLGLGTSPVTLSGTWL